MSNLAALQRALDLYGAAVYWSYRTPISDPDQADVVAAQELVAALRERAVAAGVNAEQFADAERYARERKPLLAGYSFAGFRAEHVAD